jgi:endonuclease/exonuclease/phosphatase family metal-dependent hydrolase
VRLRVVTYNIHKCRGIDRRLQPERIADVLRDIDADVVALQEVVRLCDDDPTHDQAEFIRASLGGYKLGFGENRLHGGGQYGNAVLSRLPIISSTNYDLSWRRRERRGCLRADLRLSAGRVLHLFNVHLGTAFFERRHQGRLLLGSEILKAGLSGPRLVLGDFNEWTRGLTSRLLSADLEAPKLRQFARRSRSYPGVLPLLHLDHIYHDQSLVLENFSVYRTRLSLVASDHLPLVADFRVS